MVYKTFTENNSLTFASSGDARLDFFFNAIEGSSPERTTDLLEKSWKQSPLDTMKLIINCRDIRGGKGIRSQVLICLHWLYKNELENLLLNLHLFIQFGCWKDYLNLLLIALFDILPYDVDNGTNDHCLLDQPKAIHVTQYDTIILKWFPKEKRRELENIKTVCRQIECKYKQCNMWIRNKISENDLNEKKLEYKSKEKYFLLNHDGISFIYYKFKTNKAKLRKLNEYRLEYFKHKYQDDQNFRKIYDRIVALFVEQFHKDFINYKQEKFNQLSLVSKWIPNSGRFYDKYLFILLPIATKFFELEKESIGTIPKEEKKLIIRFSRICTSMRRHLKLPEIEMSARAWEKIDYNCIPSLAILRYRNAFIRRDNERFRNYIKFLPLKSNALTPADLIKQVIESTFFRKDIKDLNKDEITSRKAIENQWKTLIGNFQSNCLIYKNTLAICDVSGSMYWSGHKLLPIYGAIGLTLFLLEIAESVWNNCCISFSESPVLHKIDSNVSLFEQAKQMITCESGLNTDLNKVFDLILNHGKEMNLNEEQMPSVLFIFTDMEFDEAMKEKTNFEACEYQYAQAGYKLPFIIFWNLKGSKESRSTPITYKQNGVLLLSGFSVQTFNSLFTINDLADISPLTMLLQIINDPKYDCIKIVNNE